MFNLLTEKVLTELNETKLNSAKRILLTDFFLQGLTVLFLFQRLFETFQ